MYTTEWCLRGITKNAKTVEEMAETLDKTAKTLRKMKKKGVTLAPWSAMEDGHAVFVTGDPDVARRFGMSEEMPDLDDDDE